MGVRPQPDKPTEILENGPSPEGEVWPWVAVLFALVLAGTAAAWAVTRAGGGTAIPATRALTPPAPAVPVARTHTVTVEVTTSPPPTLPAVPNVVGADEKTAKQTLHDAALDVEVEHQPTTDPAQNKVVIGQQPAAGTPVPSETKVTIYVGRLDHGHGQGHKGD
jgi:hypothetical protein